MVGLAGLFRGMPNPFLAETSIGELITNSAQNHIPNWAVISTAHVGNTANGSCQAVF